MTKTTAILVENSNTYKLIEIMELVDRHFEQSIAVCAWACTKFICTRLPSWLPFAKGNQLETIHLEKATTFESLFTLLMLEKDGFSAIHLTALRQLISPKEI